MIFGRSMQNYKSTSIDKKNKRCNLRRRMSENVISVKKSVRCPSIMCPIFRVFLGLTFALICVALIGNTAALLGTSWVEVEDARAIRRVGLIRSCDELKNHLNVTCKTHDRLFYFDKYMEWDVTAILMIVSCGYLTFSLVSSLSMICCRRKRYWLLCGAITTNVFTFIGGFTGMSAMIYFEIVKWYVNTIARTNDRSSYHRGWSNITGWFCSTVGVLSFVISVSMTCIIPSSSDVFIHGKSHDLTVPVTKERYPVQQSQRRAQFQGGVKVLPT